MRHTYSHNDLPKITEAEAKMSLGSRSVRADGLNLKLGRKSPAGVLCEQLLLAGIKLDERTIKVL